MHSERFYYWVAAGIVCASIGIRLIGLNRGMWLDEYSSLKVVLSQDFIGQLRAYDHPPLYYILLRLWHFICGSEEFLRLLSVIFGICTVIAIMKWMKSYSKLSSLLSGILCAVLPIMTRYSQEIRDYSLLLFATALSFLFASQVINNPGKRLGYIGLAFALFIAVATHLIGVMLITTVVLYILTSRLITEKKQIKNILLAILLPISAFIVLYFFFFTNIKKDPNDWWIPAFSFHSDSYNSVSYVAQCAFEIDHMRIWMHVCACAWALPFCIKTISKIIICELVVSSLIFGDWKRSFPLFIAAVSYWVQLAIYSIAVVPIFFDRTALPGMVPFIGFLGLYVATFRIKRLKTLFVTLFLLLCVIFAMSGIVNDAGRPYEQWGEMIRLLKASSKPKDIILFFPHYTEMPVKYHLDLSNKTVISIRAKSGIDEIKKTISEQILAREQETDRLAVFLVVRKDYNLQKNFKTYSDLNAYLKSEFGQPAFFKEFDGLTLIKYEAYKKEGAEE